jgi:DNA-binding MarR family transcriptional regulator
MPLGDRRVRNIVLTQQGESGVRHSIDARQSWVNEIPGKFSHDQLDQISDALELLASIYQD